MAFVSPRGRWLAALLFMSVSSTAQDIDPLWPTDIRRQTFGYGARAQTDIPWSRIVQGCARRDCIVAIDEPTMRPWGMGFPYRDEELVMGVQVGNSSRAYPLRILNYHEVVNDRIESIPIVVTYCPLCGSGLVFRRDWQGSVTTFGVSGLLYESDLVLYDRRTNSLWTQANGRAFAGPARGQVLVAMSSALTTLGEWRAQHPETLVLQPPGGQAQRYAELSPYGDYDRSRRLLFAVSKRSRALHPKEVTVGFELDQGVAVTDRLLRREQCIRVPSSRGLIDIVRQEDGQVKIANRPDAPVARRMFWFAWYAFNPATSLFDVESRVEACPDPRRASAPERGSGL